VVLLQNCIDMRNIERGCHSGMCATSSGVGIEVICVQHKGVSEVIEGGDHEPMTSSLIRTDPGLGFISVVSSMLHRYPEFLSV
jgi:hypothetical protein